MTRSPRIAACAAALAALTSAAAPALAPAARVSVPADRADPSAGRLSLHVERTRATGRRRGTLLYVAGGPGSAATAEVDDVVDSLGPGIRRRFDVLSFDARGTGRSGLVNCPELQRDVTLRGTDAATACARRLGSRRGGFSVDDQVADIEAVRQALRIRRLDVYGISYGTEVALRYAQAHPDRVGRVLLDSVLPPEGPSAAGLELFAGMERVMGELCTLQRCRDDVPRPSAELPALVADLRARPLPADVFDRRGRRSRATLDRVALLDVVLAGDFSPALRAALPAAIAAARRGDAAPLLRLLRLDRAATPDLPVRAFSNGMYAATSCEGLDFPWDPAADPATRRAQAAERLAALGDAPFAPFDAETVVIADFLALCLGWPAPERPVAPVPRELPAVPMLAIAGEEDLRTPVESAQEVVRRNPAARLLTVPGVGHSVVAADESGCASRAARAFLVRARGPRSCRGPGRQVPPVSVPPTSVAAFGAGRTAAQRARRTVRAIDATLDDVALAAAVGARAGGGLRSGAYRFAGEGVRMRGYAYVPGVVVDSRPRRTGALSVRVRGAAAARGRLVISPTGRFRGTLAGLRVRGRLSAGPPTG
jgi:pimeloyl-ACP methyl ester carboxylesterase